MLVGMSHDPHARRAATMRTIDQLARPQLSIVSRHQLDVGGIDDHTRRVALRDGALLVVHRGVYRPAGVSLTAQQELLAACLAAGPHTVASHRAAAWLWGLDDAPPPVELTVPAAHCPEVAGAVLHRSSDLGEHMRCTRRGVPTTTPARTLLDVGAVVPPHRLAQLVESALISRLVTVAGLRAILDELGGRGRRGTGPLRAYLDKRALGDQRPESLLEPVLARICRDAQIGPALFQHEVVLDGHRLRPDITLPEPLVIVEADGFSAHGSPEALDRDLWRQNLFIRHGYLVLRYTHRHLRRPAKVAAEIAAVSRTRRRELAASRVDDPAAARSLQG
jgi:very-short-patch-repair endonuclease